MASLPRRTLLIMGCLAGAGYAYCGTASAENASVRVALSGYDPVTYFTPGRPEKGLPEFSAPFDDAIYWFTSAEHRAIFVGDPDRYAPQFNAFCAVMVSRGTKREADPEAWAIMEGKLYV